MARARHRLWSQGEFSVVDPMSFTAVTAVLTAVGGGMAGEAGRTAWETAGGLVRRIVGHEVAAPDDAEQRATVARAVVDAMGDDPRHAREFALLGRSVAGPAGGGAARGQAVPRLLPPSVRFFADRRDLLRTLDREASRAADGRPRVVLLHGPDGIGTSALAKHWGAREAGRFPDGQLYADLRGPAGGQADPSVVLGAFLRGLGVAGDRIPAMVADRAERFREEAAGRRLLVVLDHAQSAAQVRPLLAAGRDVVTVLVARRPLAGLDAVLVPVGPLPDKDAMRLLTDVAGKPAVAAARAALPSVLERCGGSPYALRAAAGHLGRPDPAVERVEAHDPLAAAVLDAYRRLPAEAARCFRLLAVRPWPELDGEAAGAALALPAQEADRLLAELADRQLLEAGDSGRYHYRPAVRRHAEQLAAGEEGAVACAAAAARMVRHFLERAVRADRAAHPGRWTLGSLYTSLGPGPYATPGEGLTAAVADLGNVVEAVRTAGELDDHDTAWQLCEALWAAQLRAGRHDEVLPALRIGVRSADIAVPGTRIAGRMHTQLALALIERRAYDEAEGELRAAATAEETAGHARGRATAVETLGLMRLRQWRFQEAYELFERADGHLDGIGPDDEGAADLPRARALLRRHRGRALRGLAQWDRARRHLTGALDFFRDSGDVYNAARTLTDLAEVETAAGRHRAALPLIDEAMATLADQRAEFHVARLRVLREECLGAASGG